MKSVEKAPNELTRLNKYGSTDTRNRSAMFTDIVVIVSIGSIDIIRV